MIYMPHLALEDGEKRQSAGHIVQDIPGNGAVSRAAQETLIHETSPTRKLRD